MRTVLSGTIKVAYSQAYVDSGGDGPPLMETAFAGHGNGLCGAAAPGRLFLIVGREWGPVGFTVEVHDETPPFGDWEDIVEVSFVPATADVRLVEWGGAAVHPLDGLQPGDSRVRYCARGMDIPEGPIDETQGDYLL